MKSLKKKICVSVFLDELFEIVDENGKDYISNKLERVREGDTSIVRSQIVSEEILFQRATRPRKYRNGWRISHREHIYFRDQIRKLESNQNWTPPVPEKIDRETSTSVKSDDENDFDVDEYSLSDLNLEGLGIDEELQEQLKSMEKSKERVDVALSTCFVENLSNKESLTGKNLGSTAKLSEQEKKSQDGSHKDGGQGSEMFYSKERSILDDISQNNKCFLVARCAKSMNLAARNHKSTQHSLATSVNMKTTNTTREANEHGDELEELFHYTNARSRSANALKRASHIITSRFNGKIPPRISEMRHNVIGDFSKEEEKLSNAVEAKESKIIRKGFCDVTVKTFMKTNREHVLCYTLSVPWEITNLGELIIPENNLRYRRSIDDSLALFRSRPRDTFELGSFLVGTQCRGALGRNLGCMGNNERATVTVSESAMSGLIIEELPCVDESVTTKEKEEEATNQSEPKVDEPSGDETSPREESSVQQVVESLAPEIMKEMKFLAGKQEVSTVADKSINTEPQTKEEEDVTVQWELEIEIQNEEGSEAKEAAQTVSSNVQMIKAIEGTSKTNVILTCQSPYENSLRIPQCSQHSCVCEVEQCYLKDEKIRKMYLANVPRHLLHVTEQRLKEISRS